MDSSCNMLSFSANPSSVTAFLRCLVRKIIDVYSHCSHCWFLLNCQITLGTQRVFNLYSDFTYPKTSHNQNQSNGKPKLIPPLPPPLSAICLPAMPRLSLPSQENCTALFLQDASVSLQNKHR